MKTDWTTYAKRIEDAFWKDGHGVGHAFEETAKILAELSERIDRLEGATSPSPVQEPSDP